MREEGRGWRRVYKLVIWGTGHVRGSRSLRRRNKSATYDPAFPFPSSPPTDFLPPSTSLSGSPSSSSSYSSYYSSTIPFLRARPRLFIRELPSLIISPSLFRSGVAAMALTTEQIFQWFNGASRWKYRPYTRPRVPFIFPKKRLRPDISMRRTTLLVPLFRYRYRRSYLLRYNFRSREIIGRGRCIMCRDDNREFLFPNRSELKFETARSNWTRASVRKILIV